VAEESLRAQLEVKSTVTKAKGKNKSPSRKRYDDKHRIRSLRLDEKDNERLDKLLEELDLSYSEWAKRQIRKDEAMIEKKVELLASKQGNPLLEDRVRCLEDLLHQVLSVGVDTLEYPPLCPRCGDQELCRCEGREMESTFAHPEVHTWKCPKCGYFVNTYRGIDPQSIKWVDPESGDYIKKPKSTESHRKN